MLYKIFLGSLIILLFSFQSNDTIDDIIRKKVENAANTEIVAFGELLYCTSSIENFYQSRFFKPAWNSETSLQLITSLKKSVNEGLIPNDYHTDILISHINSPPTTNYAKAEFDMLLTDAFLLYTSHLLSGKVNPHSIDAEWHVVRREGNPIQLLNDVIISGEINTTFEEIIPHHQSYKDLKIALQSYSRITGDWPIIPNGVTIKKGMEDERIPYIRNRLIVLGDLKDTIVNNDKLYDEKLFNAIQIFQYRHGLENEGNIGVKTISELNISIEQRINQIKANMERWRWLPQEFSNYYLIINIANFNLNVIRNGNLVRSHKIIAGKPYRRTPVFSSKMNYLVINPTWTIPPTILNVDVLPGVRKDSLYLEKKKILVYNSMGNPVNISGIDWNGKSVKSYTYQQPSGPNNALGAVKFMFPNSYHVYLHDTPAKEMFDKSERAFSSGCIRVQDPLALAEFLIDDPINWNREKIDKLVAINKTQTIILRDQPNVYLLYLTAWTENNGVVHFRKDVYDRDKPLIEQLKKKS